MGLIEKTRVEAQGYLRLYTFLYRFIDIINYIKMN